MDRRLLRLSGDIRQALVTGMAQGTVFPSARGTSVFRVSSENPVVVGVQDHSILKIVLLHSYLYLASSMSENGHTIYVQTI